jgi:two-component system sensor histidine kinase/response regulator
LCYNIFIKANQTVRKFVSHIKRDKIMKFKLEQELMKIIPSRENALDLFVHLFELNPNGIGLSDPDHRLVYVNKAFTHIFGYNRSEAIGSIIDDLVAPKEFIEEASTVTNSTDIGDTIEIITRRRRKDGSMVDVHITASPIILDDERIGHFGIYRDISEEVEAKNRAKELIRNQEEIISERTKEIVNLQKFQTELIETMDEGLLVDDEKGNITFVNHAAIDLLGFPKDEIIGSNFKLFVSQDQYELLDSEHKQRRKGKKNKYELRLRKKSGELIDTLISGMPRLNSEGNFIGTLGTITDISHLKTIQKKEKQARIAAETANRAKSDFLANMSHEIRTPMNGVIGMTNILLDEDNSPETRNGLETIKRSAETLLNILNDILDFSKIEAGKLDIEHIDFNLRNLVDETLELLAMKSHEKGIELTYIFNDDVPSLLIGDPGRVRQILMNLTGNAVKFTDTGGDINIIIKKERETKNTILVKFSVTDTGIGMSAKDTKKLFQSFHQVDTSTTRKYGGTGLGLAISKQLSEMMGGKIDVKSKKGKGSTFTFTIKFGKQHNHVERTIIPPEDLRGKRVLIIDDNRLNLEILEGFLKKWELEVESTDNGRHGVQMCKMMAKTNMPFDLVITDYQMPDLDGARVGKMIREHTEIGSTKMIMLTSRGLRGEAKKMKEIGFDAYLSKPIRRSQLFDSIILVFGSVEVDEFSGAEQMITKHAIKDIKTRNIKVLVAEDHPVNQKVISRILEKQGFQFNIVSDGNLALEALEKDSYDLVLMDVQMPVKDGYETTRAIRQNDPKVIDPDIPIIALTAHAMKGDMDKCIEAGMNDYATKPIDSMILYKKIKRLLSNKKDG